MLLHGGRLREAARIYDLPLAQWLDLSTGVNPRCYPLPDIPVSAWNRLPEDDDGLIQAASDYYRSSLLLPVAGTQAAIQALPLVRRQLFPDSLKVAVPKQGYQEHRQAWQRHGYQIQTYDHEPTSEQLAQVDVVVVINPNNPTAYRTGRSALMAMQAQLARRQAWLVVDEAFIDCTPEYSISSCSPMPHLVVLRSVGKFFGLAGVRTGFVLASEQILEPLQHCLGPWTVSGPARAITRAALRDTGWQHQNREYLSRSSQRLRQLLNRYFTSVCGTQLFCTVKLENPGQLHQSLCAKGIFTRLLDERDGLRFGLPEGEQSWATLECALEELILRSQAAPCDTDVSKL